MTSLDNLLQQPNQIISDRCLKLSDNACLSIINHLDSSNHSANQHYFRQVVSNVIQILYKQDTVSKFQIQEKQFRVQQIKQQLQKTRIDLREINKKYDFLQFQNIKLKQQLKQKTQSINYLQSRIQIVKQQIGRLLEQNRILCQQKQIETRKLNNKINSYDESSQRINRSIKCYSKFITTMIEQNNKLREENMEFAINLTRGISKTKYQVSKKGNELSEFQKLKLNFPISQQNQTITVSTDRIKSKQLLDSTNNKQNHVSSKCKKIFSPFERKSKRKY